MGTLQKVLNAAAPTLSQFTVFLWDYLMPGLKHPSASTATSQLTSIRRGREGTQATSTAQGQPPTFLISEGQVDPAIETSQSKEPTHLLTC